MRWLILLFISARICTAAVSSGPLAAWYADQGVTSSNAVTAPFSASGRTVASWLDASNGVSLSQAGFLARPSYTRDYAGRMCIEFPWAYSTTHPTNFLTNATFAVADSASMTLYAVVSCTDSVDEGSLLNFPSWGFSLLQAPQVGFTSFRVGDLRAPINPAVLVTQSDGGRCVARVNHKQVDSGSLPGVALTGIEVGGYVTGQPFSGRIYAIVIYGGTHSDAVMGQNVEALANMFRVQTNYTKEVWCNGDSITIGLGSSNHLAWPTQLAERLPNIRWYNGGIGGIVVGTNGDGGGTSITGNASGVEDAARDSTIDGTVFIKAGVNDLNSVVGMTGLACYGRITNYARERIAAGWNRVVAATIAMEGGGAGGNVLTGTELVAFNAALRERPSVFLSGVSDSGANSPFETRLNDSGNASYFYDGLHLVNEGYAVVAEHGMQLFNQPRRATGFW